VIQNTETLVEVDVLAQRLAVPAELVYDWIEAGLEHERWNGRVLTSTQALARFRQVHRAGEAGREQVA
jgi:hypothetical protein